MGWLSVLLLGGVVGLDATSFPQAMVSRPLVAGTLAGLLAGRPVEGLAIGALLEVFSLVILPIGAARYPESGTASVAAVGGYVSAAAAPSAELLLGAVLFGLGWERLATGTVVALRRRNERLAARYLPRRAVADVELERRHLYAMTLDFGRGALVALAGAVAAYGLLLGLALAWGLPAAVTLAALTVAAAALLGTSLPLFGGWSERRLAFGFGIVCGLLVLALA